MSEVNKLNDEDMDNVSGGMIFNAKGYEGNPSLPWEVVANHNCQVLGAFGTRDEAVRYAQKFGKDSYNTMEVDWSTVQRLRNNPNVN